jgi:hypothetical protein
MQTPLSQFESVLVAQHGLITIEQLRNGELSEAQRQRLVERRVLRRVRPRVFGIVGASDTWERGLLAVVLSADGSVASHSSAARLWNLEPRPEARFEITIGRQRRVHLLGVTMHSSVTLDDDDIVPRSGVACTSFERTLCDCTTLMSEYQVGRALDDGLRRGVASLRRLSVCSERLESGPGRHMSAIRSVLATRGIGFDPGGSRSELHLLEVLRRARLPLPVQQYRVNVGGKNFRPDFAWPESKIFAEYYGLAFHSGASAVAADSERLTALSAAGWLPLVFTHQSSDREIVERTTAALDQRGVARETSA